MAMIDKAMQLHLSAVDHCDKGEWAQALPLIKEAVQLQRSRTYVDLLAKVFEELGQRQDAARTRQEAAQLLDSELSRKLETALELRSDREELRARFGRDTLQGLSAGPPSGYQSSQSDEGMLSRVDPVLNVHPIIEGQLGHPFKLDLDKLLSPLPGRLAVSRDVKAGPRPPVAPARQRSLLVRAWLAVRSRLWPRHS